ncbi:hypothetical protein K2173_006970 [Erythroxylum novogranatense]|uniref:Uncharacterized protein n=1 Tax=Erythroxylum novogranatense TaxID=1862640 RepID=A0AAV8S6X2_9ROSI|nr:hypothetical protein K2173_006970 [Erythroxylum novogranatense]
MKRTETRSGPVIDVHDGDDEDGDFLSQIAEVEAKALSSAKRRCVTAVDSTEDRRNEEEGPYLAALRGSKSVVWQQMISTAASQSGHFKSNGSGGAVHFGESESSVPEKKCACGLGSCVVFTANTERNRGRKFYRCPVRQENGGCGFFEWCDNASSVINSSSLSSPPNYAPNSAVPDLPCPCGAGTCLVLTAKTGKNVGQQFYRCPANQASACGFFKWCNGNTVPVGLPANVSNCNVYNNMNDLSVKSGSSCFKCGKEGHWAKDCSFSQSPAEYGGSSGLSVSSCFKCGKAGHWAKDCSISGSGFSAEHGGGRSSLSGSCYKCGKAGHWAKDCTSINSPKTPWKC